MTRRSWGVNIFLYVSKDEINGVLVSGWKPYDLLKWKYICDWGGVQVIEVTINHKLTVGKARGQLTDCGGHMINCIVTDSLFQVRWMVNGGINYCW